MFELTFRTVRPSGIGLSLRKRRRWFDGDGTPPPTTPPATPPADDKGGSGKPNPSPPPPKTLTQAEADAIIGNRVKEAKQAALDALLKDLGEDNLDALKEKHKKLADLEASQLSELEKAQKAVQKIEKERDDLKAQVEAEKAARLIDRRNTAIAAAASDPKRKAHNAKDVIRWAEDEAKDALSKVIGEDGAVNEKEATALVEACKKTMPHYFATSAGPGSPSNRDGGVRPPEMKVTLTRKPSF